MQPRMGTNFSKARIRYSTNHVLKPHALCMCHKFIDTLPVSGHVMIFVWQAAWPWMEASSQRKLPHRVHQFIKHSQHFKCKPRTL